MEPISDLDETKASEILGKITPSLGKLQASMKDEVGDSEPDLETIDSTLEFFKGTLDVYQNSLGLSENHLICAMSRWRIYIAVYQKYRIIQDLDVLREAIELGWVVFRKRPQRVIFQKAFLMVPSCTISACSKPTN